MVQARPRPFEERGESALARMLGIDWLLALAAIGLIGCSLVALSGITREDIPGEPNYFVARQAIYGAIGVVLMLVVSRIDYSRFRELRIGLYSIALASIGAVLLLGGATRGSRRWIELPFFTFQPSELGKLLLILAISGFVIDRTWRASETQRTARLVTIGLIPAILVTLQPDLGTSLVYVVVTLAVLFVAGVSWKHFAALGGLAAAAASFVLVVMPATGFEVLHDYQTDRLTAFVNPSDDPRGEGYQIKQSLIAIGSGQKTGRGDEATQSRLDFLPERHTDFAFAAVGEQYGFVGAAIVLSLFALLIWRALRILTLSKNFYGALIAGGVAAMLIFQVFVNVGMNLGLMPITGIPLPLVSYGGSSVLVTFLSLGALQSIYVQARRASKGRAPIF